MSSSDDPSRPRATGSVPSWRDAAETRRVTRAAPSHRRRRDIDTGVRAQLFKMISWSFLGGVVGGLLGVFGTVQGVWDGWTVSMLAGLGWAISFTGPLIVSSLSGRAARTLYTPSGSSTPRKQGHSLAESLAARGMYEDGIAAFEAAIAANSREPIPYIEIARNLPGPARAAGGCGLLVQASDQGGQAEQWRGLDDP